LQQRSKERIDTVRKQQRPFERRRSYMRGAGKAERIRRGCDCEAVEEVKQIHTLIIGRGSFIQV
jgi:hypothetical protein